MNRHPGFFLLFILLFGSFATEPVVLAAQTAEQDANGSLVFKVNAHTVVVDVVVTDRDGKPVRGLRGQDFRIEEDGHTQKIGSFEEHGTQVNSATSAPQPVDLPTLPPNIFINIPRVKLTDVVTVVLLDSLNTELKDQSFVRGQMLKFFQNPQPVTRIAIFGLGAKLHFIQGFTDDPAVLKAAMKDLARGSGPQNSDLLVSKSESQLAQTVSQQLQAVGNAGRLTTEETAMVAAMKQFLGEGSASQADLRVSLTLEALQEIAHYLAGIPGRKNLVWFSSAFPITLFPNPNLTDSFAAQREFTEKVRRTSALLAASQIAVYPIAAEGLTTDSLYDVNAKMAVIGEAQQKNQIDSLQTDAAQRIGNHTSMEQIAEDTGGRAIMNTNGLSGALAKVADAGANFYTLSYIPSNSANDGQFRKIQVKLPGGYKLDYRRGYFASYAKTDEAAADKPRNDPLGAFMGPGKPDSSEISLALQVLPAPDPPAAKSIEHDVALTDSPTAGQPIPNTSQPARAGENSRLTGPLKRYTVDFLLTAHGLQMQRSNDGAHHGKIEAALIAYSQDGRALNWTEREIHFDLDPQLYANAEKTGLNFRLELDVPKDAYSLRSGVYDLASDRSGSLEVQLSKVVSPAKTSTSASK